MSVSGPCTIYLTADTRYVADEKISWMDAIVGSDRVWTCPFVSQPEFRLFHLDERDRYAAESGSLTLGADDDGDQAGGVLRLRPRHELDAKSQLSPAGSTTEYSDCRPGPRKRHISIVCERRIPAGDSDRLKRSLRDDAVRRRETSRLPLMRERTSRSRFRSDTVNLNGTVTDPDDVRRLRHGRRSPARGQ